MEDHFHETTETWNRVANVYDEKFHDIRVYDESYRRLLERLPTKATLLDIGCGPAIISSWLKQRLPEVRVTCADVSENMLELARKRIPDGEFIQLDCRHPKFDPLSFDAVVAGFLFPYFNAQEVENWLLKIHGALKESGTLYISFVPGSPERSGFKTGSGGRVYFQYHEPEDVLNALTRSGFCILSDFDVEYPAGEKIEIHKVYIAQKQ